jgi:hypothetical protein
MYPGVLTLYIYSEHCECVYVLTHRPSSLSQVIQRCLVMVGESYDYRKATMGSKNALWYMIEEAV